VCLARVDFVGEKTDEPEDNLTDVAWIEPTPAGLRLTDLFGNVTELEAEIQSIDFMESVVTVERRADSPVSR